VLFAVFCLVPSATAQWHVRLDAGLLLSSGRVAPSTPEIRQTLRSGASLGGGVEYTVDSRFRVSMEVAWRERGVLRYFREQMVEQHRYQCIDAAALLRWSPYDGELYPFLLIGGGAATLIDALVELGFHDRFNFVRGTEGMRTVLPLLLLGGGVCLDFRNGARIGLECVWQNLPADFYRSQVDGGPSFRARGLLLSLSLAFPIGCMDGE